MFPRLPVPRIARRHLMGTVAGTEKGKTARQQLFGDHMREWRIERGMSQEALGLKSGFDRSYIGALEAGWRNPSLETICRIAKALKVDAADLVAGTQAKKGRA